LSLVRLRFLSSHFRDGRFSHLNFPLATSVSKRGVVVVFELCEMLALPHTAVVIFLDFAENRRQQQYDEYE